MLLGNFVNICDKYKRHSIYYGAENLLTRNKFNIADVKYFSCPLKSVILRKDDTMIFRLEEIVQFTDDFSYEKIHLNELMDIMYPKGKIIVPFQMMNQINPIVNHIYLDNKDFIEID